MTLEVLVSDPLLLQTNIPVRNEKNTCENTHGTKGSLRTLTHVYNEGDLLPSGSQSYFPFDVCQ